MYGLLHSVPTSLASGTRLLRARAGDSANSPFLSVAGEQTALDGPVVLGLCYYWSSASALDAHLAPGTLDREVRGEFTRALLFGPEAAPTMAGSDG